VLRGCCAINRIAVKGVRTPTFKGCGTRLHTCRGEGRYGALQGGGATMGSVALRALPCAGARCGRERRGLRERRRARQPQRYSTLTPVVRNQSKGRVRLSNGARTTLAERGQKRGKYALEEVASIVCLACGIAAHVPYCCITSQYDRRSKGRPRLQIQREGEASSRVRRYARTRRKSAGWIGEVVANEPLTRWM